MAHLVTLNLNLELNPIKQDGSKSLALGLEKLELLEELILCIPGTLLKVEGT